MLSQRNIDHKLYNEAEKLLHEPMDAAVTHVLMDIRMPHINGVDLCRALKKVYENRVTYSCPHGAWLPEEQRNYSTQDSTRCCQNRFAKKNLLRFLT